MALLERRAGHSDAEIADLKMVVSQYPQSRDARRDLGISYYQQHKYPEAIEQFEALQAIDSDDLAAHYNLSILYRRMGMEEKAATQAALFAIKKTDPAAAANSLDFLREHTEVSTEMESVPWHLHTELAQEITSASALTQRSPRRFRFDLWLAQTSKREITGCSWLARGYGGAALLGLRCWRPRSAWLRKPVPG